MSAIGIDLTVNEAIPTYKPGQTHHEPATGKHYMYIKHNASAAAAVAVGTVLYALLTDINEVTDDVSVAGVNQVVGIGQSVITVDYYGWIQTWGDHDAIKIENGNSTNVVATGDMLQGSKTADGLAGHTDLNTASTNDPIGPATTSATGVTDTTVAAFIKLSKAG